MSSSAVHLWYSIQSDGFGQSPFYLVLPKVHEYPIVKLHQRTVVSIRPGIKRYFIPIH